MEKNIWSPRDDSCTGCSNLEKKLPVFVGISFLVNLTHIVIDHILGQMIHSLGVHNVLYYVFDLSIMM